MELRQLLTPLIKWAWLIVLSVIIASAGSYFASREATPLFRTKTTLMVGQATRNPDASTTDLYTGQQLAYTYIQLARREPVLKGAIESLGLQISWEALANQVSAAIVPQTQLMEISVIDSDPYRAKIIADAIAQQLILQSPAGSESSSDNDKEFIRSQMAELKEKIENGQGDLEGLRQELDASNSALQIQELQNQITLLETKISGWQNTYSQLLLSLQGGDVNVLNVVEEANIPQNPISPNIRMNVLVAAAIGLALSVGGIFLMEYMDDTIRTAEDVERATGLSTIGMIANIRGKNYPEKLIANLNPLHPNVEEFRVLRNNILQSSSDAPFHLLLFTSANPSEGKSVCMANLAVVMANMNQRVIVVDADFRRPTQNQIFNIANVTGLSDALQSNDSIIDTYLKDVEIENLKVLTSGPTPENPELLLESKRLRKMLKEFKNLADIVLIDSSPMMAVTDATILSNFVDGVVLVVDAGKARSGELHRWMSELHRIHLQIPFIGVVLNRASNHRRAYYYYSRKHYGAERRWPFNLIKNRKLNMPSRMRDAVSSNRNDADMDFALEANIEEEKSSNGSSRNIQSTLEEAFDTSPPE